MTARAPETKQGRDIKLDLFRGLSLFIILIDHTRGNVLSRWTPGNFGLSDAASVFIFVSGYTVALAFGRVYRDSGWMLGTARTLLRVWQLYISQLVLLMVVASLPSIAWHTLGTDGFGSTLKLDYLFIEPGEAIWHAITLSYVPPGLDILPVYVVMMAMIPAVMAVAWVDKRLVPVCSLMLWAASRHFGWTLLADPSDGRGWFFDPFAWQLVFLTGFCLAMGWLPVPPRSKWLQGAAIGMLVFGLLVQVAPAYENVALLGAANALYNTPQFKTMVDPLCYLYFLSFAYVLVPVFSRWLGFFTHGPQNLFVVAGQQSLAVFLGTVVLADVGGVIFDVKGTGTIMQVGINVAGFLALTGLAYLVSWYKSAPWKIRRPLAVEPEPAATFLEPVRATARVAVE